MVLLIVLLGGMEMSVTITAYDGVGMIGGNKILLESGGTSLFLDFGTSFGARSLFFEEFLKPRSSNGLGDLLELGLLPPLRGIYRKDLEPPAPEVWARMKKRPLYREAGVDGILLTHGHIDHSGYISFLDLSTPVYSSLITATISKAMQDTSPVDFERELCYATIRGPKDGLLSTSDARKSPYEQRRYVAVDRAAVDKVSADKKEVAGDGFVAFWNRVPKTKSLNVCAPVIDDPGGPGNLTGQAFKIGSLEVKYLPVDHSIPGAGAFAVCTGDGWIVYTGDLRLHGRGKDKTLAFVEEAAKLKPLALICEGTHPRAKSHPSEDEVYENAKKAVLRARDLVIADFGPRNVERLLTFYRIAREAGRRLGITTKDAYLLEALSLADNSIPSPLGDDTFAVYGKAKLRFDTWEKEVLDRYAGQLVHAKDVRMSSDTYILCFSFFDLTELIDIQPGGGIYIYSSCEPFNEEMQIDFKRLTNWVTHFGFRLIEEAGGGRGRFHASGHIHGPGLLDLIREVQPGYLIPVHTEDMEFFRENIVGDYALIELRRGVPISLPARAKTVKAGTG